MNVWQVQFICFALLCASVVGLTTITGAEDDDDTLKLNSEIIEDETLIPATGRRYEVGEEYAQQDHHAVFRERAKPLRNLFVGIYKNYKSTYIGNKTSSDYRQRLRERIQQNVAEAAFRGDPNWDEDVTEHDDIVTANDEDGDVDVDESEVEGRITEVIEHSEYEKEKDDEQDTFIEATTTTTTTTTTSKTTTPSIKEQTEEMIRRRRKKPESESETHHDNSSILSAKKKKNQRLNKKKSPSKRLKVRAPFGGDDPLIEVDEDTYHYALGPDFNMSLDMSNDIVNVNLDGEHLQEVIYGRWLSDNSDEGRGKKYDMMTKVLPLFILPFLIQSAIVPFLVTKLKLLLMKSILVGKLAIFLLIISAIRGSKSTQTYEASPSYWAGEPSRRSELAAASAAAYNGYRVDGKPAAWIN